MIIDASAIVAVIQAEGEAVRFSQAIAEASVRRVSAATFVEAALVLDGRGDPVVSDELDYFLARIAAVIEPVTEAQARIARRAYRDYGKGSGHPARLNFGDCLAYALAKDKNEPMLFKGTDFGQTDIKSAV
ncbi:MAG: type II toxin-antitoxin system VapC family toxin [Hyphomonadaceae bacterium]|nr:type II toxin-antitoxin system VapC family toxin [Hyphomonadaceae bacterium]